MGSSILIQGSGFGGTTGNVLVGNLSAPVQLWSDTSIIVTVPFNADVQAQLTQPAADHPGRRSPCRYRASGLLHRLSRDADADPQSRPDWTPIPPATAIPARPTGC